MENKEYLSEEEYQNNAKKLKKDRIDCFNNWYCCFSYWNYYVYSRIYWFWK